MDYLGFKQPKSLDEMIIYLKENKNVEFNEITESVAKEILYRCNYINIITPFKFKFCKKVNGKIIKDDNGNHIYEKATDFKEYYNLYMAERSIYPNIYKNIISFETDFNFILSYEIINGFAIYDINQFFCFVNRIRQNIENIEGNPIKRNHLTNTVNNIAAKITTCKSIYILFDRLSLNEVLTIFRLLDTSLKERVFSNLKKRNLTFERTSIDIFEKTISKVIIIRNYVCHCNSLEILKRYYNPNEHELRTRSDYRAYSNLIATLSM